MQVVFLKRFLLRPADHGVRYFPFIRGRASVELGHSSGNFWTGAGNTLSLLEYIFSDLITEGEGKGRVDFELRVPLGEEQGDSYRLY